MPLFPAKSTSFSDAILGLSCVWAFVTLEGMPWRWNDDSDVYTSMAKVYFATTLAAAFVGIFRFGSSEFFRQLATLHETLSWLALIIGLPCLVSQFYLNCGLEFLGNLHLLLMLPPIFSYLGRVPSETESISRFVSTVCAISLVAVAVHSQNYVLLTATTLMAIASTVHDQCSGSPILGFPAVDWFHYGIACSNYFLVTSLRSYNA